MHMKMDAIGINNLSSVAVYGYIDYLKYFTQMRWIYLFNIMIVIIFDLF